MAEGHRRDVAAYSDLVTARSPSLFRTAYLMVGDHQLAQDLLQESLVKTYVAWSRLRDVAKAEAYARRTIVNTAISWRRRRSFHERPVDVMPDVGVADRVDELRARSHPTARGLSQLDDPPGGRQRP
jgi:DNA-directed RNA polymerase specialized sigma24 family protein